MSLRYAPDSRDGRVTENGTPVVDAALWKGVLVALPVSAACWGFIIGLGYLGYRLSAIV